jgi:soluble lytic murein transglycosylase-like protein
MKKYFIFLILFILSSVTSWSQTTVVTAKDKEMITVAKYISDSNKKVNFLDALQIVTTVYSVSEDTGWDPLFIISMIKAESNFLYNARSSVGAVGLMQVWPKYHMKRLAGRNPKDIYTSVDVGVDILQECFINNKKVINKALACYSGHSIKTVSKYANKIHNTKKELVLLTNNYVGVQLAMK